MTDELQSEIPQFGMVPDWVNRHPDLDAMAVRVYVELALRADRKTKQTWPKYKTIADAIHVKSKTTIANAVKRLTTVGAVAVTKRFNDDGEQVSNLYTVMFNRPPGWTPPTSTVVPPLPISEYPPYQHTGTQYPETENQSQISRVAPKARNVWWDAMTDVFGYEPDPNTAEPGLWGKAIKVMKADPGDNDPRQELIRRVLLYVDTHKDAPVTVAAIMNKWRWLGGQMANLDSSRRGALRKAAERDDATQRLSQWVQRREAG